MPLLMAAALVFPATALANEDLERAVEAYERTHYAESVQLLHPAAAGGNLRAQEMLGLMHLYGAALYGTEVPRDLDQARYWLKRAEAAGSSVAVHALQWTKEPLSRADVSIGVRSRSE